MGKVFCVEKAYSGDSNLKCYFIEDEGRRYAEAQLRPYDGLYDKELCEMYGIEIDGLYTKSLNVQKEVVLSEIEKEYEKYLKENSKDK